MNRSNVVKSTVQPNRSIIHEIVNENGTRESIQYSSIKAGLNWPSATMPGYYCVSGELWHDEIRQSTNKNRGKIVFLSEFESSDISIKTLMDRLTDDVIRFGCESIYTLRDEGHQSFVRAFYDFTGGVRSCRVSLHHAPYTDNFILGLSLIEDLMQESRLDLPVTTQLFRKMKSLRTEDLQDAPESKLHIINALRYVIAAYEKYLQFHTDIDLYNRSYSGSEHGWMGV
jgi:hypothetical protein